jgi:hypothetical protein
MPIIVREADDPLAVRVSIGRAREPFAKPEGLDGYYVVYRGTIQEVLDCLRKALEALEATAKEGLPH